jgi:hypothetical protein
MKLFIERHVSFVSRFLQLKMHDFLDIKTECVNTFKLRTSAAQHKCMHGIYLTGIASLLRQQALRQLWQALLLCFGNKLCASSRHCFFASATSFAPVASEWWWQLCCAALVFTARVHHD